MVCTSTQTQINPNALDPSKNQIALASSPDRLRAPDRQTAGFAEITQPRSPDCRTPIARSPNPDRSLESQITKRQDRRTLDRRTVGFAEITQPLSPDRRTFRASDRRAPDPHLQTRPKPSET
jgi:hypothetical protein